MIVPPSTGHGQPTPRTRALVERITSEIATARMRDAKLTDAEVRAALSLIAATLTPSNRREAAVGMSVALGVFGLILGVGLSGKFTATNATILTLVLAGVVLLVSAVALVVVLRNRN